MKQARKTIWLLINLFGGAAVIGSYLYGFLTQPNAAQVLWGGVPEGLRPLYTVCMFVAAAGYFLLGYYVFRLNPTLTRVADRFSFGVFNILYLFLLIPSALWMPLTLLAAGNTSVLLTWIIRLDLVLVAFGSLGLLLAVLFSKPRPSSRGYILAVAGSAALCFQTVILDAIIWSLYF